MFNNKRRLASAWAKGLMLGKAVGARDEQDRIIKLLIKEKIFCDGHWQHECKDFNVCELPINGGWHGSGPCEMDFMGGDDCKKAIALIRGKKND